jgi:hypothetical protein
MDRFKGLQIFHKTHLDMQFSVNNLLFVLRLFNVTGLYTTNRHSIKSFVERHHKTDTI